MTPFHLIAAAILCNTLVTLATDPATQPAGGPRNTGEQWIFFQSAETLSPPMLVLTDASGGRREIKAAADTVLIAYLADRAWGRLPSLSVNLCDTNEVLLRFDLDGVKAIVKAELVLDMKLSDLPPVAPFEIALYEITTAWDADQTTWDSRPAFAEKSVLTAELRPIAQTVRLDVTPSVKRWIADPKTNHGWLIKAAKPLPAQQTAAVVNRKLERELLGSIGWAASIDEARAAADERGKPVLAVVRAAYDDAMPLTEQMLLAICFTDPAVHALIDEQFVPVRVLCHPNTVLFPESAREADPLKTLGASAARCKPLALVVATSKGELIAALQNIGTFDPDLVFEFLAGARRKAGLSANSDDPRKLAAGGEWEADAGRLAASTNAADQRLLCGVLARRGEYEQAIQLADTLAAQHEAERGNLAVIKGQCLMRRGQFEAALQVLTDSGETVLPELRQAAGYYRGCLLYRAGRTDDARRCWTLVCQDAKASTWALRAKARLEWPDYMAMYECLARTSLPADHGSTEIAVHPSAAAALIGRAIDYLLGQQRADGSWSSGENAAWDAAVTALVAKSLVQRRDGGEPARRARITGATSRATRYLDDYVASADPNVADSFSTAYTLDFFLDLFECDHERDPARRKQATAAIALLAGGQCDSGAWSYNRQFGHSWSGGFGGWPKTSKGRMHSMNTGPALLALARARALGLDVDGAALKRGRDILLEMRREPGVFTYTYPEPISFNEARMSIGRAAVCEHALVLLDAAPREDLRTALDNFLKYRADLRPPVKLTASWVPPACVSSYFYFFAYYHAALALSYLDDNSSREQLSHLRTDILAVAEADGTWVDYERIGKPYGTAMALMVLKMADDAEK